MADTGICKGKENTMMNLETRTSLQSVLTSRVLAPASSAKPEPQTLAEAVQVAIRTVEPGAFRAMPRSGEGLVERPQSLLALLVYSYARGIYSSREIEDSLWRDESLRALSDREIPRARELRRFRRDHREAICQCLKAALAFLSRHFGSAPTPEAAADARWTEEANVRLMKAMFIDQMELEDGDF